MKASPQSIEQIISQLSLEEKASLCSGRDFWQTKAIERLGIESVMLTDGPHGLRKQSSSPDKASLHESVPATCFPPGALLAATWDRDLIRLVGQALGEESMAERVGVILGPAVNIKRSPLCGRNFEYLSEDPYLAGELASQHIQGIQERGVGSSIKHFAVNNQETCRMTIDVEIDERSLREIYLPAFETAVRQAKPWTVMCAYNKINGTFCSENPELLTTILRDEWEFDGLVMSDWGACNDRVAGLAAGLELEMPGNGGLGDRDIVAAVQAGRLPLAALDLAVSRILTLYQRIIKARVDQTPMGLDQHHELARRVAREGTVLLKNDGGLLPLAKRGQVALIGEFARNPRYQGGGSSHMNPARLDAFLNCASQSLAGQVALSFAPGYSLTSDQPDPELIKQAQAIAQAADCAIVCIGLTDAYESEGFDRDHLDLPPAHTQLLRAILQVQPKTIVVLSNGSPVSMPWIDQAPTVLEAYLGGQGGGGALVDILWGDANPCGKLAETFPRRLEDNPSYLNFPGEKYRVEYREGLFVGYRHYDALKLEPLFPFGHGLSYTSFEYGPARLDRAEYDEGQAVRLSVSVTNSGARAGREIVQVYIGQKAPTQIRPIRELKAFAKVELAPGESRELIFSLDRRAFAFWDSGRHDWTIESDTYEIWMGASSRDLRSRVELKMRAKSTAAKLHLNSLFADLLENPATRQWAGDLKAKLTQMFGVYEANSAEARMTENLIRELPLRNIVRMGGGQVSPAEMERIIQLANQAV